ncbi:MAG: hypothetical protein AABX02_01835 [archaeon]
MSILFQTGATETVANTIAGNVSWLALGIGLFVLAAIVIFFLKNILVNAILGVVGWAILTYVFQVHLPFLPSLIVSAIFGLAGLGAVVLLAFFGIIT